ncbi:MAG TPA: hypothetical protein VJ937_03135 [Salinivirga sp.]|uniref:hypothetical protein n=1 Tax=Salinivirga sp. TaxID=1970192 RepID=UPI002B45989F|nr:hypothetical protein [Salinivirga sp.]HKK58446.1 hypothetical protein [Salinivirga sp.]
MRKLVYFFTLIIAAISISCSSGPEVSPEMQGFMDEISATGSMIDAAEKYGYNAQEMPLDLYELKEPTVKKVTKEGEKVEYLVNIKHGLIDSDVIVVWKDKVIVNIKEPQ